MLQSNTLPSKLGKDGHHSDETVIRRRQQMRQNQRNHKSCAVPRGTLVPIGVALVERPVERLSRKARTLNGSSCRVQGADAGFTFSESAQSFGPTGNHYSCDS